MNLTFGDLMYFLTQRQSVPQNGLHYLYWVSNLKGSVDCAMEPLGDNSQSSHSDSGICVCVCVRVYMSR